MAIHRLAYTVAHGALGHVRAQIEHRDQLRSLQAVEITQYMVLRPTPGGPPYAHTTAGEIGASAVLHHRAEPVVACGSSPHLEPYDPEIEVELIVNTNNLLERDLEEPHRRLHSLPAQVHEGHGLEKDHVVVPDSDLRELALELVAKTGRTPTPGELVHHHVPHVVSIADVLGAGVSESGDEVRAHGPPGA